MASNGTAGRALRVLDNVTAPYRGRGQFAGIVVGVGNGTVNVHFMDGDFAAGIDATTVSLRTGRRPRASAGLPLAVRMRVALLNAPETELVVVAFDDAYAVVSGPEGNRAYQRDMLCAFDPDGDSSDDEVPASQLVQGETVMVGRTGHVATVEQAPRAGDDKVLVRWESTRACEEVVLSEVEKLSAGRSSRRSAPRAPVARPRPPPPAAPRGQAPPVPRATPSPTPPPLRAGPTGRKRRGPQDGAAPPPKQLRGSGNDGDDPVRLDLDSDNEAPAAADGGDAAPMADDEDAAPPPPSTEGDAALAAALALAEQSSDDENAAPPSLEIPSNLRDFTNPGICDAAAAPLRISDGRPPPRACRQPKGAAPPPPPAAPPPRPPSLPAAQQVFAVGERVQARWRGEPKWSPAWVTAKHGSVYDLHYDDGYDEFGVAAALIRSQRPRVEEVAVGTTFVVRFRKHGQHRGTVRALDGGRVTIEWSPVILKAGERIERPETTYCDLAQARKYLVAAATGQQVACALEYGRVPSMLELYAGTAVLSREMQSTHGWDDITTVDNLSWPKAAPPTRCCDILEFGPSEVGWRDAVQAALACRTWGKLAIEVHRPRYREGIVDDDSISDDAREANKRVLHTIVLLKEAQRVNPNVVITVENPATGYLKCFRPWQDAVRALGLTAVEVTYCKFGAEHRKATTIWTNCKGMIRDAAGGRYVCSEKSPCRHYRSHSRLEHADASDASEYPGPFCAWMGTHINAEAEQLGARRED